MSVDPMLDEDKETFVGCDKLFCVRNHSTVFPAVENK